ncbi:hypothetical protein JOC78_002218 [Bacillus ectoiniformans]|uniref:DUF4358 domain-containing protein n=1 Tax=Bacillus ectoiniformans TaxID=1494429 RepID=UPI00195EFE9D|nr:DUF4358 domain-containing protein [Bacillus ectoiniformans]MBM7649265.1 hypothetical protein [Bacillus ectoiniformans]
MKISIKNLLKVVLVVYLMGILSGCGLIVSTASLDVPMEQIDKHITQSADLSDLKTGNFLKLKQFYGVTREEVDEFTLYRAPSNIRADETVVIKVKDPAQVEIVKEKLIKRVDQKAVSFKDYLPEEYYLIENYQMNVQGTYILLTISKDADSIVQAFQQSFKQ